MCVLVCLFFVCFVGFLFVVFFFFPGQEGVLRIASKIVSRPSFPERFLLGEVYSHFKALAVHAMIYLSSHRRERIIL